MLSAMLSRKGTTMESNETIETVAEAATEANEAAEAATEAATEAAEAATEAATAAKAAADLIAHAADDIADAAIELLSNEEFEKLLLEIAALNSRLDFLTGKIDNIYDTVKTPPTVPGEVANVIDNPATFIVEAFETKSNRVNLI